MAHAIHPIKPPHLRKVEMMTATEKALKAKKDYDALIQAAIKEQLGIIKVAQSRLADLGYNSAAPRKATAPARKTSAKAKKKTRQIDPDKPCGICHFPTVPNHDKRKHRGQGKSLKAFSPKELEQFGLKKK